MAENVILTQIIINNLSPLTGNKLMSGDLAVRTHIISSVHHLPSISSSKSYLQSSFSTPAFVSLHMIMIGWHALSCMTESLVSMIV